VFILRTVVFPLFEIKIYNHLTLSTYREKERLKAPHSLFLNEVKGILQFSLSTSVLYLTWLLKWQQKFNEMRIEKSNKAMVEPSLLYDIENNPLYLEKIQRFVSHELLREHVMDVIV
jgi:hypothetical protein